MGKVSFNISMSLDGEQAQLELVEVVDTPLATHLRYRVPA